MNEIITINGKRYRKLKTIRNGFMDLTELDIFPTDKWCMINGIEYEELKGGDANASSISRIV